MPSILIIDDEDSYLELCRRYMPEHTFLPPARNYREAADALRRHGDKVDLVLLDVHFDIPEADLLPQDKAALLAKGDANKAIERLRRSQGLHILAAMRERYPDLPVIVMTSRDDLPLETDAERLQAEDYTYLLADDYLDARSLKLQIDAILARRERPAASDDEPFYWGVTGAMANLRRRLTILARGRLPIIIQGATGTGKSLVAREFIHPRSQRPGPFVAVDLSTLPTDLMAAHLFGVIKGAYTGATSTREGVLTRAHGGTLFLDEIGNLSLELQKSLLLVLQEGVYRPVGAVKEIVTDVKIVVATNENLGALVRAGRFREDLYMRLNPATAVTLPSLHERRDDFEELLAWFMRLVTAEAYNRDLLAQYAEQRGLVATSPISVGRGVPPRNDSRRIHFLLHPSSFKLLHDFEWPGNFRQFAMTLSNLVTFTLVELVERAEKIEPERTGEGRADVIPIPPKIVSDLLRPMTPPEPSESSLSAAAGPRRVQVEVLAGESLNAVSCAVERQYLEQLYDRCGADLGHMGELLLGDEGAGRKVQLRMNQLGIKLRSLKRKSGD
jgi:DNA-binding NtrC family response regulator